ncbi:3-oxoacyl-ACP reductase [Mycobacterium gallinarum]|uniref:3-oxoacyl-ACP reductase n=1 Tax=Mycobacterium gallinarum TaxID=39689 RepID=A0A9W4FFL3_9MYCO|nr:SDR family oxidoreductase [Mycobacterium gallinarum]BBY93342.1 3-oxoacyl-ACP reductase [Mycobacterium gallinarum]
MSTGRLAGKAAIVTGAGRGIGRSVAEVFAAEGAHVAVVSKTPARVEEVVAAITAAGGSALGVECDVTVKDQIRTAVDQTVDRFGRLDVLVNNAHHTTSLTNPVVEISDEQLGLQFGSGPAATLHFMQASYAHLKESHGVVINFGSGAGVSGAYNYGAYAAAKEAIRALSRSAAREWGRDGIRVNVICPTTMTDGLAEAVRDPAVAKMVAKVPLGMPLRPEESVAPVALFLASDDSKYITGSSFMVDGGASIDAGR